MTGRSRRDAKPGERDKQRNCFTAFVCRRKRFSTVFSTFDYQNFSACQSVEVWFLPSVDILWSLLFFSSFCTYFFLFSKPGAQDPRSFYFSFIHSSQVLSLYINDIFSFILILTWKLNGGKLHFKPAKLYCLVKSLILIILQQLRRLMPQSWQNILAMHEQRYWFSVR